MSAGIDRAFVIQECLIPRLLLMFLLGLLRLSSFLIFWRVWRCFYWAIFGMFGVVIIRLFLAYLALFLLGVFPAGLNGFPAGGFQYWRKAFSLVSRGRFASRRLQPLLLTTRSLERQRLWLNADTA